MKAATLLLVVYLAGCRLLVPAPYLPAAIALGLAAWAAAVVPGRWLLGLAALAAAIYFLA